MGTSFTVPSATEISASSTVSVKSTSASVAAKVFLTTRLPSAPSSALSASTPSIVASSRVILLPVVGLTTIVTVYAVSDL